MSNAPIRSSRRIPRAPSRLVAEAGADVVHVAPVVATEADVGAPVANTPPSSLLCQHTTVLSRGGG